MIQYSLPGLTTSLSYNLMFLQIMHSAPEMFFDDIKIGSMYGNFPGCIMNGGRIVGGTQYTYDQISDTFDQVEKENLSIRLTFTNMLLRPEHFEDEYSNQILKAAQGRNVKVIVNLDELGDYISSKYDYKLILSTTRALNNAEEVNQMLNRYDTVVLDYNHNKDDDYLSRISDPSRLEVMPNLLCRPGCQDSQLHYEHESCVQLGITPPSFKCKGGCETYGFTSRIKSSPTILGNDDIRKLYFVYGIYDYKLVGRTSIKGILAESYLYYLVRPEYHFIINQLLTRRKQK